MHTTAVLFFWGGVLDFFLELLKTYAATKLCVHKHRITLEDQGGAKSKIKLAKGLLGVLQHTEWPQNVSVGLGGLDADRSNEGNFRQTILDVHIEASKVEVDYENV